MPYKFNQSRRDKIKKSRYKAVSDVAIETALLVRQVFRLPLRQTEGFRRVEEGKFTGMARVNVPAGECSNERMSHFIGNSRTSPLWQVNLPAAISQQAKVPATLRLSRAKVMAF